MPRLPVPGSDSGTWGDILNEYLGVSLTSTGELKPNIVDADNIADGALTQAKVQNLTTDLANKVDTSDSRLTPNQVGYYPPQGYGFFAMSEPPTSATDAAGTGVGSVVLVRTWVPAGNAITSASALVASAGTLAGGGANSFAIYDDDGTLVAQTPSSNSLWTSTGWRTGTFSTPIAAQSTGRFVFAGLLVVGYSGEPQIFWNNVVADALVNPGIGSSKRRSFYNPGQTNFPASFNPASYGTINSYIPMIGLA